MANNKLVIPEARAALNQFKMEMAKEMDISTENIADSGYMASYHTGMITRKLVELAEKQLMDE